MYAKVPTTALVWVSLVAALSWTMPKSIAPIGGLQQAVMAKAIENCDERIHGNLRFDVGLTPRRRW